MPEAKYQTPEYLAAYKALRTAQRRGEWLICCQPECVMTTRAIAPNQRADVGHDTTGTILIGPTHASCNRRDGAIRGNRMRGRKRHAWRL